MFETMFVGSIFKKIAGMVQKQFARRIIQKWMVSQQKLSETNQPCGSIQHDLTSQENDRNFCDVVYGRTWVCYPENALKSYIEIPMKSPFHPVKYGNHHSRHAGDCDPAIPTGQMLILSNMTMEYHGFHLKKLGVKTTTES